MGSYTNTKKKRRDKKMRSIGLRGVYVGLVVLCLSVNAFSVPVLAEGQEGQDTSPEGIGPYEVGWIDISNISKTGGKWLPISIHYPAIEPGEECEVDGTGAPYPTLIFGIGYGGVIASVTRAIAARIASWGFVFILVGSRTSALTQERSEDLVEALNWIDEQNDNSSFKLSQMIDESRFGVSGYSFGGGAAILTSCNESRFRVLVGMAACPESYPEMDAIIVSSAADIHIPIFLAVGTKDPNQMKLDPKIYGEGNPPKFLIIITDASHESIKSDDLFFKYAVSFLKIYLYGEEDYISYLYGEHAQQDIDEGKIELYYDISESIAKFEMTHLNVDPSSVEAGESVIISIDLSNTGSKSGAHTVVLEIDGDVEGEQTVTLNPDETRTVSFQVSAPQLGSFSVEVDGLSGSYTVTEPVEEEKKPLGGIPGFPYESIILGLVVGIFIIWLLQRR